MARQSATQHLGLLEAANLVTTIRRGREKLHYLNPVPLWDIAERWIEKFERPRLRALSAIRHRAEEEDIMAERRTTCTSPTSRARSGVGRAHRRGPDREVLGHSNVSDWQAGSPWEHRRVDGSGIADVAGTVLESIPPRRLAMTFDAPAQYRSRGPSRVTFDIEPYHEIVRLTVTHENLADESALDAVAGWPAVFANLKSLLETGHVLPARRGDAAPSCAPRHGPRRRVGPAGQLSRPAWWPATWRRWHRAATWSSRMSPTTVRPRRCKRTRRWPEQRRRPHPARPGRDPAHVQRARAGRTRSCPGLLLAA